MTENKKACCKSTPCSRPNRGFFALLRTANASAADFRAALREVTRAETEAIETDEAGRVGLVIPALHAFHRRDIHVVERVFRFPAARDDVALVELQANGA